MAEEHVEKLEYIGFAWKVQVSEHVINQMIQILRDYKLQFRNLLAPETHQYKTGSDVVQLGSWVSKTRNRHRKGKLREEVRHRLDSIGFIWDLRAYHKMPKSWIVIAENFSAASTKQNLDTVFRGVPG